MVKITIPDIYLERFLLNELEGEKLAEVKAYVETVEGKARLQELKTSNEEILTKYPAEKMIEKIQQRTVKNESESSSWLLKILGTPQQKFALAGSFAVIIFFLIFSPTLIKQFETQDTVRLKGFGHHIVVYRKSGDDFEKLANNTLAYENDELQISYVSAGLTYGLIFSVDGTGSVTLHLPKTPGTVGLLKQKGETPLRNAFQLDDAPKFEKFFFLASDSPINHGDILNKVATVAAKNIDQLDSKLKSTKDLKIYILTLKK